MSLKLEEVERPIPTDDEVLIKIHAVSINGSDREGLIGKPFYARLGGLRKPGYPILGSDIAGRVERAGKNITQFQPGDEVFGESLAIMAVSPSMPALLKRHWHGNQPASHSRKQRLSRKRE